MLAATVLREAVRLLSASGVEGAARDARILLAHALNCKIGQISVRPEQVLTDHQAGVFHTCVSARCKHQPVAQIIGWRAFWGREFEVTRDVLDPRPDSETLIERALAGAPRAKILDLGTGTGCLAITLLAEWPAAFAMATDISPDALKVASANAAEADVFGRLSLTEADWFDGIAGRFDLIICNPPYVTAEEYADLDDGIRNWEPKMALCSGKDGLAAYRKIAGHLSHHLTADGTAILEIGHRQAAAVRSIFKQAGFGNIRVFKDLNHRDRGVEIRSFGTNIQ